MPLQWHTLYRENKIIAWLSLIFIHNLATFPQDYIDSNKQKQKSSEKWKGISGENKENIGEGRSHPWQRYLAIQ